MHVGIDPGLTGAIAVIDYDEIEIHDTPVLSTGKRHVIDAARGAKLLREIKAYCERVTEPKQDGLVLYEYVVREGKRLMVTIEKSQPMPPAMAGKTVGHGSIASFSLGQSFGIWIGILAALEIPYQLVAPATWKAALMKDQPKEKDASRLVADHLFPGQRDNWWPLKKHHGRCDALLIAEWGRRNIDRNSGKLEE